MVSSESWKNFIQTNMHTTVVQPSWPNKGLRLFFSKVLETLELYHRQSPGLLKKTQIIIGPTYSAVSYDMQQLYLRHSGSKAYSTAQHTVE